MGIKAEMEKSKPSYKQAEAREVDGDDAIEAQRGSNDWLEVAVEVPGLRDDDSMPVFLAAMLTEALLADGEFAGRLWINRRFHWKLYLDVSFYYCSNGR